MERIFLGWDEPALPLAAHTLLDHYRTGDVARLDGAVVVLPGSRAGRRLKEILAEESTKRGLRLVPPQVVTVGGLPELVRQPALPLAPPAVLRLAWASALRGMPREPLQSVFARLPDPDAGDDEWLPLARETASLHREVARGGHDFRRVAHLCRRAFEGGRISFDDAGRWHVLSQIQERYAELLGDEGLADPELDRMRALERGGISTDRDVWLVGIPEMPGVVRRTLEQIGGVRILVHAPESAQGAFDALGCVIPVAWSDVEIPLPELAVRVADQPGDQADEVAECLAELSGSRAADEIAIGALDGSLVPWLEERLGAAGVPVRDAAGLDLRSTGPHRLIEAVAELLGTGRWEAFAALVRHPQVEEWLALEGAAEPWELPGRTLPELDDWFARHLFSTLPAGHGVEPFPGSEGDRGQWVRAVMERVTRRLPGALATAPDVRPLSEWVVPGLEFLRRAYGHREFDRSNPSDRRTVRALAALADAMQAFRWVPSALDAPCRASTALRLFLEQAAGSRIPEIPDVAAVEVMGWLELHLDDAPATVITGVNEPWLPESINGDPFLPDSLRSALGLEDNAARYARDAYRLTAMIHSTRFLRLVVGRRTLGGDPLRPSRLLFAAGPDTVAHRVLRFFGSPAEVPSHEAAIDSDLDEARPAEPASPERPAGVSAFRLPPEPVLEPGPWREHLNVTDFGPLLSDPYGFALKRLRRCEPVHDQAREMDPLVFGTLAHRVLERFGRDDIVHGADPGASRARLEELLDHEVRSRFGAGAGYAHPAVKVQVEHLRARLDRFADWHADRVRDGWRVLGVECRTPPEGVPLEVDGRPTWIHARIDRIDHHPETGDWAVFDYKTGDLAKSPKETHRTNRGSAWSDLQLPLYRWILPGVNTATGTPVAPGATSGRTRVGYILLSRDLEQVGGSMADWDEALFEDALEEARRVIRGLRGGPIRFDPGARGGFREPQMEALLGRAQLVAGPAEEDE